MKLKKVYTAGKLFSEWISKPYYSRAKHDSDPGDMGNYMGPIARNLTIFTAYEIGKTVLTGRLPELPLQTYQDVLVPGVLAIDCLVESMLTPYGFGFDYLKNKIRIRKP